MLSHLCDGLGQLLKLAGPTFLPVIDRLAVPVFGPLLAEQQVRQNTKSRVYTEYVNSEYRIRRVG